MRVDDRDVRGVLGNYQDITQRKQEEQALRRLIGTRADATARGAGRCGPLGLHRTGPAPLRFVYQIRPWRSMRQRWQLSILMKPAVRNRV